MPQISTSHRVGTPSVSHVLVLHVCPSSCRVFVNYHRLSSGADGMGGILYVVLLLSSSSALTALAFPHFELLMVHAFTITTVFRHTTNAMSYILAARARKTCQSLSSGRSEMSMVMMFVDIYGKVLGLALPTYLTHTCIITAVVENTVSASCCCSSCCVLCCVCMNVQCSR